MRASFWAFVQKPFKRQHKGEKEPTGTTSVTQLIFDTMDLMFNLRGIGWSWSKGLRVPKEERDVNSVPSFLASTLYYFITSFLFFDFAFYAMQFLGPTTIASPTGSSIFDPSLPPLLRYARATLISYLTGFVVTESIQAFYYLSTLIFVGLLGQTPEQWPHISDTPWWSPSLSDYWSHRWHQLFRDCFINFCGKPFSMLTGRAGGVMGAFLASGLLHDWGLYSMGRGKNFRNVAGYFLMQGVGVMMEHTWKAATGKRVGGFLGWAWSISWVVGWGIMLLDAWASHGLVGSQFIPEPYRPSVLVFGSVLA